MERKIVKMMKEQDEDVSVLAKIVRRQKEMGLAINREVEEQDEIFKRMNEDVDRVQGKVDVAKKRTRNLG